MPADKKALLEAIENDDVDYLQQNQANIDAALSLDDEGNTALHVALIDKKPNVANWLIKNNLYDPNAVNSQGLNVFECALRRNNMTFAEQLFESTAKPSQINLDCLTDPGDEKGERLIVAIGIMAFYGVINHNSKIKLDNKYQSLASYLKRHYPSSYPNLLLGAAAFQLRDWVNQLNSEQAVSKTPKALKQIIRGFKLVEPIKDLNTIFIWLRDYHQQHGTEQLDEKLTTLQKHVYQHIYEQQKIGWRWRIAFTVIACFLLTPLSLFFTIPFMLKPYRAQMLRKETIVAASNQNAFAIVKAHLNANPSALTAKPKAKPSTFFKTNEQNELLPLLRKACYQSYKIMTPQQAAKYRLVKTALEFATTTGVIANQSIRDQLSTEYQAAKSYN